MNKFIRAIEILMVAIITDYIFLLSGLTVGVEFIFILLLILLPFLCSFLFYMIIQAPSSKEKVAFTLFRLILLYAFVGFLGERYLGGDSAIFLGYVLYTIFLDAVLSVLVFYLMGWWIKRKQFSVSLGVRGKKVVTILMTCFMIITIPILFKRYWNYFDGSWSGTFAVWKGNDGYEVVLDQHRFCYNDVVEADFTVRNGHIVIDMDSIRIKENSSDIYTDSQKLQMLDEIITLADNDCICLGNSGWEVTFYHDKTKDFIPYASFGRLMD